MVATDCRQLNILVLEPYDGGSHRAFLNAWMSSTRHHVRLLTLPARKWKWRMRGAAIWFAQQIAELKPDPTDLIFTCDMLSVADLRALLPANRRSLPIVTCFHENQLTYPVPDEADRDYQYGFTNITSCLTSDEVWFNSEFHRTGFLAAADALLKKMPDFVPPDIPTIIADRSHVVYPIVEQPPKGIERLARDPNDPPVLLWNHRWEYDKNPEPFFNALVELDNRGVDFRLVLLGETFRDAPAIFDEARRILDSRILHAGFAPDRRTYWQWLHRSDIVVSSAIQENFGISIVEAVLAGCRPLLPNRLSYPELIPINLHERYLYANDENLAHAITGAIQSWPTDQVDETVVAYANDRFAGNDRNVLYDNILASVSLSLETMN